MKNKHKGLHIPPIRVYDGTCIQEFSKERNGLRHIYPGYVLIQQPKSRSEKKAKVAIISIANFHEKGVNIGVILADFPNGKSNRNSAKDQYII